MTFKNDSAILLETRSESFFLGWGGGLTFMSHVRVNHDVNTVTIIRFKERYNKAQKNWKVVKKKSRWTNVNGIYHNGQGASERGESYTTSKKNEDFILFHKCLLKLERKKKISWFPKKREVSKKEVAFIVK